MKKFLLLISMVACIIMLVSAVVSGLGNRPGVHSTDQEDENLKVVGHPNDEETQDSDGPPRKLRILATGLRNSVFNEELAAEVENDDEEPNLVPPLSKEELEREEHMEQVIEPVYWERAPEFFDEMISEQQKDIKWTSVVSSGARKILEQEKFSGTTMHSAECYQTLCKAVVAHEDERAYNVFSEQATNQEPWDGPMHSNKKTLPSGEIEVKMYFTKTGDDELLYGEMKKRMFQAVQAGR